MIATDDQQDLKHLSPIYQQRSSSPDTPITMQQFQHLPASSYFKGRFRADSDPNTQGLNSESSHQQQMNMVPFYQNSYTSEPDVVQTNDDHNFKTSQSYSISSAGEAPYSQVASPQLPAQGLASSAGKNPHSYQLNNSLFKFEPADSQIVEDDSDA